MQAGGGGARGRRAPESASKERPFSVPATARGYERASSRRVSFVLGTRSQKAHESGGDAPSSAFAT